MIIEIYKYRKNNNRTIDNDREIENYKYNSIYIMWSIYILYLGMLVGVPIPESEAAFGIQEAVDKALAEAQQQNIKGKQITPFLLAR